MNRRPRTGVYLTMETKSRDRGFTLVELALVCAVIAVVAAIAAVRFGATAREARITTAWADLAAIRDAFTAENGYLGDLGGIPGFSPACIRVAGLFIATNVYGVALSRPGAPARVVRLDEPGLSEERCLAERRAIGEAFTTRDDARRRGWRGPYLSAARLGVFPRAGARRREGDATFEERNFYPRAEELQLPSEFGDAGTASVYGFADEPALLDPWGNPYVVQVPPPQAFRDVANATDAVRFGYARAVSAGPDGVLDTPCFARASLRSPPMAWNERGRRLSRQAGLAEGGDSSARGDDLVLFFSRADIDEGSDEK